MIWIAIVIGLGLTVFMLSLCYVSGQSERRTEHRLALLYERELERQSDLREKWSDPPEVDDE